MAILNPMLPEILEKLEAMEGKPLKTQIGGDHYTRCAIQPWEVITRNGMDYFGGNVLKYIMRFANKNGKEDLLKAQHYLAYMIEHYDTLYRET